MTIDKWKSNNKKHKFNQKGKRKKNKRVLEILADQESRKEIVAIFYMMMYYVGFSAVK